MTTSNSQNEQLVRDLYAACGADDWDKVQTILSDDFRMVQSPSLPFGGIYRGWQVLKAMYASVIGASGRTAIDFIAMTSGDGHVMALVDLNLFDHGIKARIAEIFRIENGRISEVAIYYFNPAEMQQVYAEVPKRLVDNFGIRPE